MGILRDNAPTMAVTVLAFALIWAFVRYARAGAARIETDDEWDRRQW